VISPFHVALVRLSLVLFPNAKRLKKLQRVQWRGQENGWKLEYFVAERFRELVNFRNLWESRQGGVENIVFNCVTDSIEQKNRRQCS